MQGRHTENSAPLGSGQTIHDRPCRHYADGLSARPRVLHNPTNPSGSPDSPGYLIIDLVGESFAAPLHLAHTRGALRGLGLGLLGRVPRLRAEGRVAPQLRRHGWPHGPGSDSWYCLALPQLLRATANRRGHCCEMQTQGHCSATADVGRRASRERYAAPGAGVRAGGKFVTWPVGTGPGVPLSRTDPRPALPRPVWHRAGAAAAAVCGGGAAAVAGAGRRRRRRSCHAGGRRALPAPLFRQQEGHLQNLLCMHVHTMQATSQGREDRPPSTLPPQQRGSKQQPGGQLISPTQATVAGCSPTGHLRPVHEKSCTLSSPSTRLFTLTAAHCLQPRMRLAGGAAACAC